MRAPVRRRRLAVAGLAMLAVAALLSIAGGATSPVSPPGPAASHRPSTADSSAADSVTVASSLVDVALLPPGGRDGAPRLLTVDHDPASPGRAVLTVLERTNGRWSARAGVEHRPPTLARTAVPWLVALDERSFVLVSVAPEAAVTWLATVTWTGEELRVGPVGSVGWVADAATAADAFGDGTRELVLIESRTRRGGGTCQGSDVAVLDGSTLQPEVTWTAPDLRLAAGATGELDATPGADLVAASYSNCPAGPAVPNRLRLVGVRLADGELLVDRRIEPADSLIAWSGRPAIVDVDRDDRREVLIGSAESLVVFEPDRGWDATEVGGAPGILLGATGSSDTNGATVATMGADAVRISRLQRNGFAWTVSTTLRVDAAGTGAPQWDGATVDVRSTAIRSGVSGWLLDDGVCPSLVVPLAIAPCDTTMGATPGPAWVATRPIATLPDRRLLVAQTEAWRAPGMRLVPPSPIAIEPDGAAWRQGPSEPFSLVESTGGLNATTVPDTRVDGFAAGSPPVVGVSGPPGTRVVTVTQGGGAGSVGTGGGSLSELLANLPGEGAVPDFVRIPAAGRLELDLPPRPDGATPAWMVNLVAIGPVGDVSPVIGADVAVDATPPAVALDDAFFRPPWPVAARVTGRTEPGATVSDGTRDIAVGADGAFAFEARLAPWPQRLTVRATDPAGNVGTASADVVGGPDVRRLPWIPILVIGVVAGAALNGLRGRRTTPPGPTASDASAYDETPAVEELQVRRLQ